MKKISVLLASACILFSGCKKTLDKEFYNPENYNKTGNLFSGLFSSTLYKWKTYVQDYGEWWWEIAGTGALGVSGYSQVSQRYITDRYAWFGLYDDLSGANAFGSENQLWQNRFGSFYKNANAWPVIQDNLSKISGQELDNNIIYYHLITVIKDYAALMTVDFYNAIPYSEAFRGKERVFFPKYDDPKEIYISVLNDLKKISEELPAVQAKMTPSAIAVFQNQDIAFHGDINKWIQYMNALRLKYALRISGVDEATAKTHINDVLSKNNLPQTDMVWQMPYKLDVKGGGEWTRGLFEAWPGTFITDIIMKRMNYGTTKYEAGTDDPRLPVIAFPTKYSDFANSIGDYRGVSMNADAQKAPYNAGDKYYTGGLDGNINEHFKQNSKSFYNFATITMNNVFPVYMMTKAEVDLVLAEISLKNLGNTGKTASEHIKNAIGNSTDFWYARNAESSFATSQKILHPTKPDAGTVSSYANIVASKYNAKTSTDDKLEIIMQQKYIHLNIMCPYELWTELRRTRHPKLEPMTFNGKVMKPLPERLRYPTAEQETNPDNYAKVKSDDNFTNPIFWVPQNLRNVNPYWSSSNFE
ncbi:SusD/RagB family nutrient-binding outer membrane lipoprotein [Sphingobacterium multivorum]|uniref:SusD/RagB family nutrient-binding outer membrane lipoprotein n=1 Tax=Sphingobacterium multivorum TaxID=28454 RepID=UPI0028A78E90|nr:SusD/RagB family nutrient-binding outer membrane lipoprotein [Sphingobacterium multivorum]